MKKKWLVWTALENNSTTLEVSDYQVNLFFDCFKLKLLHINLKAVLIQDFLYFWRVLKTHSVVDEWQALHTGVLLKDPYPLFQSAKHASCVSERIDFPRFLASLYRLYYQSQLLVHQAGQTPQSAMEQWNEFRSGSEERLEGTSLTFFGIKIHTD